MQQLRAEFEQASRNSQHHDGSIRKSAEIQLKEFSSKKDSIEAAKFILDTSAESAAQFHATIVIKDVITRQNYRSSPEERLKWVHYLVMFVMERYAKLEHFVRGALLQTVAISTKIGWMDSKDAIKNDVMNSLQNLMGSESVDGKKLGLTLIAALINEFLFTNGTTSLGLPIDFHHTCQASFQKTHLLEIFKMVLQAIHTSVALNQPEFINSALVCAEKILCWDFQGNASVLLGNKSEVSLDKEKAPPRLPLDWKDVILVREVTQIFFQIAQMYENEGSIGSKAITCLVQLAGIHGPVFESPQVQQAYLSTFISSFQSYTYNVALHVKSSEFSPESGDKVFSVAQIAKQLFTKRTLTLLASCPGINEVFTHIGEITLLCLKIRFDDIQDSWFLDAVDDLLSMWASLVSKTEEYSPQEVQQLMAQPDTSTLLHLLSQIASETVKAYIHMRVTTEPPAEEDGEDFDEKDVDSFSDQLLNVSILARINAGDVLPALITILNEKANQLISILGSSDQVSAVMTLQEQIHWGILIGGHVVCDSAYGETPVIPSSMLQLSAASQSSGNDPLIQLTTTVCRIIDSLGYPLNSIQHGNSSPLLVETLFWYFDRWASSYLFANAGEYSNLSMSLQQAYGVNGAGKEVLLFLLNKIEQQSALWYNEMDIIHAIIDFLQGISKNRTTRDALIEMAKFTQIVHYFLKNIAQLPASSHGPIIQTIVYIASHSSDPAIKENYFKSLCGSIETSLLQIVQRQNFTTTYQSTVVRERVVVSLQKFGGLAISVDETNTVIIFECIARHFDTLLKLLDLYHSYPDVELFVITIFKDLIKNQCFDDLQAQHHQFLYKTVHNLIGIYAKNEVGRHRKANDSEEEELFEDLSILFQLLSELILSEYDGFEQETVLNRIQKSNYEIDVPKVVFVGINSLLPLVTQEMLLYPRLCLDYVQLVSLLVEYFPDRLSGLPQTLLSSLLESLLFGMNQSIGRISDYSFKAVQSLGLFNWSQLVQGQQGSNFMIPALEALLTKIMESLLTKPLDTSILNEAADTVFALSLCCPNTLQNLFSSLMTGSMPKIINELVKVIAEQHQKQSDRLAQGNLKIGWGSPGLERYPSLRPYRKLFATFILEARAAILVK